MARPKKSDGDKSILSALKEITKSDDIAYYIVYLYAPELLDKDNIHSYSDLQAAYVHFEKRDEKNLKKLLYKESSQKAIKYLLKRIDTSRDIELLNKYYELSKSGDVQALKAYIDFKRAFFADNSETDELKSLLQGATLSAKEEEFEMNL